MDVPGLAPCRTAQPVQQQEFIQCVDQRMHALAEMAELPEMPAAMNFAMAMARLREGGIDDQTGTGGSGHFGGGRGRLIFRSARAHYAHGAISAPWD